jgi:hypothetical protein
MAAYMPCISGNWATSLLRFVAQACLRLPGMALNAPHPHASCDTGNLMMMMMTASVAGCDSVCMPSGMHWKLRSLTDSKAWHTQMLCAVA